MRSRFGCILFGLLGWILDMEYTYRSMLCCSYACTLFSWLLDVSGSRDLNVPPFVLEKRSLMSEITSAKGVGRIWMEMEGVGTEALAASVFSVTMNL